ncbi:TonB-dependent receptor [Aggregatimonas sangjinii]|uniref:TonB-dependent receptor n=1 Tax=Aggregatimonas sangjinii TaxID=2583587 RepID=A0A5B7SQ65_9FLAO|nr:TonB-dependent receptor [Aggregatimonas sangjinii]QCW99538.1 TonB-dependent receptor [Aggregatimonas sangjinii]
MTCKEQLGMKRSLPFKEGFASIAKSLAMVLTLLLSYSAVAQTTVSGTVSATDGTPIPAVNIVQKGTTNGVSSDFDGNYTIRMQGGSQILVFSSLGFATKEMEVGDRNTLNVTLEEDSENLDEVVVIGYAPVSRKKVLGALASVKSEEIVQATPTSAFDAVQGKLAGVQILTNNGPGGGFDISIRGVSTFGAGTSPLYVVDGQQLENIDNLDPNDIKTLEVLKDGATAAIYGSKAANGVVLITTKSGRQGDLKIDVSTVTGYSTLVGDLPVANSAQRLDYVRTRTNRDPENLTGEERDSLGLLNRNSFDLQDLVTRPSTRTQTNVALSGGGEKGTFYWNTGYLDEQGIVINSGYKRLNTLLRIDANVSSKLKAGTRINLSFEDRNGTREADVFRQIVQRIPNFPLFEPNGDFTPTIAGRRNPLAAATINTVRDRRWRTQVFNYAEWAIFPNVKLKSTLGINFSLRKREDFIPSLAQGNPSNPPTGQLRENLDYDIQQENFVNYSNSWGDHDFAAFAGMQIQRWNLEYLEVGGQFVSSDIRTFNNVDPLNLGIDSGTGTEKHNLFSLFGGFNYDYKNKYLLSASVRRDGSSRFGDENEYGLFPAASIGWRISNENFLKESTTVNNLLLKASYGEIGNERIANYAFTSALVPGANYTAPGVSQSRIGNPELSWESTTSVNLGLELDMFRNRLNLGIDFWEKTTTDLLAQVPLPEESGFSSLLQNVGAIENRGIDFSIGGDILRTDKFVWNSNFNISYLENEVTELAGGTAFFNGDYQIAEGEPIGNIFGFENTGIFQYTESNAFTDDGVQLTPNFDGDGNFVDYSLNGAPFSGNVNQLSSNGSVLEGGDIIWADLNGDFNIDPANDRKVIGNGLPEFFGGWSNTFRYGDFTLSTLFDYSLGADIWARWDEDRNDLRSSNQTPNPIFIENAWREEGDVTVWPRLNRVPQLRNRPNSFYVQNGDWIKLRYVRLNYNFPRTFIDKVDWLGALSVNLAVNNVLTWTEYTGYNPELGRRGNPLRVNQDDLRYPNDREIILGLNFQFK